MAKSKDDIRSPTAHRSKNQMRAEGVGYNGRPEQVKNREERNSARAAAIRDGKVRRGDNLEIDHRKPLIRGGSNKASNQQVLTRTENRKKGSK
jgi:hypothetical protein